VRQGLTCRRQSTLDQAHLGIQGQKKRGGSKRERGDDGGAEESKVERWFEFVLAYICQKYISKSAR